VIERSPNRRDLRPLWQSLAIFLLSFFVLQFGWNQARGTRLEHWVIDCATVRTSVALINTLTPKAAAVARGPSILAPDGGINVRNGCEGTEVLFLLVAALLAYPFSWRLRLVGTVAGAAYVFLVNQLRLLALFYSIRNDRFIFNQLHGLIAPFLLIACTLLFFVALRSWDRRLREDASG
jgi:exosortase/archaeosortase family protein